MKTMKMPNHEYAQCLIIENDGGDYYGGDYTLQSYSTIIVTVEKDGWMRCNGLYSRTTIKHIGWFMRYISEKFGVKVSYYDAKWCYEHNSVMNILTGEVKTYGEFYEWGEMDEKATA